MDDLYPVFFDLNLNQQEAENFFHLINDGFYFDRQTSEVEVKFALFNGQSEQGGSCGGASGGGCGGGAATGTAGATAYFC